MISTISRRAGLAAALRVLLLCAPLAVFACGPGAEGPAPTSGATSEFSQADRQSADKHSDLTQITAENVDQLRQAWVFNTGDMGPGADAGAVFAAFEDEPVLVDGNLIVCSVSRRVIALDPATGQERWRYDPGGEMGRIFKCRGVSVYIDDRASADAPCKTRLIWATADNRLIAIDSKTGQVCEGFGERGIVQIEPTVPELFRGELTLSSRPAIVNDVIVVGSAVADNQRINGPSGRVLAFDARTGRQRWAFDPLPRDRNDPAARTWGANLTEGIGGGNVWSTMSADEERDIVYLPTTSPLVDFYGGMRPGDNLYSDSIVALRGSTGEMLWHFQTTHHDVWDYDLPTAPMLIDYPVNGENVPALIQLTKQGLIFILNRVTGEPIVPVEERPVPQEGGLPDEQLSPTQPFPVGMPTLAPQGFSVHDAWSPLPWDNSCREATEALLHGPIYTPPSEQGTIFSPGSSGGANWGGGSYDPETHILIVPTTRVPMVMTLIRNDGTTQANQESIETTGSMTFENAGTPYLTRMAPLMSSMGTPCGRPPWAALMAIDIVNKTVVWDVPLGTIDRLAPVPLPIALGTPGAGGPLATAGGVVFIGFSLDQRLRAFDIRTGEELWKSPLLPASANSTPITYEANGEQYVVVAAGGHSMYSPNRSDAVVAYRLPRPRT